MTPTPVKDGIYLREDFEDANEFIGALRPVNHRWITASDQWLHGWHFRGQKDANWELRPSAWRTTAPPEKETEFEILFKRFKKSANEEFDVQFGNLVEGAYRRNDGQWPTLDKNHFDRVRYLLLHAFVEYQLLNEFVILSDKLGHKMPNDRRFLDNFLSNYANRISLKFEQHPKQYFEFWNNGIIALAQHHGVPTRLLDFTFNPLIAAYFAAGEVQHTDDPNNRIAVYAFHNLYIELIGLKIVNPLHNDNLFLHAQDGAFIYNPHGEWYYVSTANWPSIEQVATQHQGQLLEGMKPFVPRKLTLPVKQVGELLRLLWIENITRAHVMPTFDNITKAVVTKWQWALPVIEN